MRWIRAIVPGQHFAYVLCIMNYPASLLFVSLLACASPGASIGASAEGESAVDAQSPEEFLGRPVGTDFELADWGEVSGWYKQLAAGSARVQADVIGHTTGGREFMVAVISGEESMGRLDEIQAATARIADPRGLAASERAALVAAAKPVLFVSCSMHSTETAGTEFGMQFAWNLATSNEEPYASARRDLVVVIVPTINPDGLDEVVHWYEENKGTPYEGTGLKTLYQHYAGHDNNRDWFGLSLEETRLVTEQIYKVWRPTVYWDVHQQGQGEERFFVPPFRDPLNPNLDAGVITAIDAVGSRALFDLTRRGFTGISTGVSYDMWWNGGNRNVPVRHNIIGLLTEAASVNIASPIFLSPGELRAPGDLDGYQPSNRFPDPWPGGWWRLSDIIRYELGFGESLLGSLVRDREVLIDNAIGAAERAMQATGAAGEAAAPRAWILPASNKDRRALHRLVDILDRGGVEVHSAAAAFEADGRAYAKGSLIVYRDQPYGQHVKDLFEVQRYPDGAAPYDVAGWTLPILFGLRRVEVVSDFDVTANLVADADDALGRMGASMLPEVMEGRDGDEWAALFGQLSAGGQATFRVAGESAGSFALGTALDLEDALEGAAEEDAKDDAADEAKPRNQVIEGMPRVGVYGPWTGSMNEGWLRWVLDGYGVEYTTLRPEAVRAGALGERYDVIVLPSMGSWTLDSGRAPGTVPEQYERGLDPEGAIAIEEFVRAGGRLVTMQSSAAWATDLFDFDLEEVTSKASDFSCPGSVLRAVPTDDALAAGLPASLPFFFSRSLAWTIPEKTKNDYAVALRYANKRVLYSGWIKSPETIEGQAAWVRATYGKGHVDLFGFRPQYRSWSQAAFPLLFRALLLD